MKFVTLRQSTPEWLDWRRTGITASDVSVLFDRNPYKTEWKLWAEKSGLQAEDDLDANPYVRRGKVFEHLLREHVSNDRDIGIIPVCVEHDTIPFLKASLDGLDHMGRPWEFKIPSSRHFEEVRKDRIDSEPAQRYWPQVQQQLLVTGAAEGYIVFGNLGSLKDTRQCARVMEYIVIPIPADQDFHQKIIEKSEAFLRRVKDGDEPAKDPDRDVFAPQDALQAEKWSKAASDLLPLLEKKRRLRIELDSLDEEIDRIGAPIVDVLDVNKFGEFAGVRATRVDRKGKVDWQSFVKSKGYDPEDEKIVGPFRRVGSTNYLFTPL